MALLGISLILATVVIFCLRRPAYFISLVRLVQWQRPCVREAPPPIREPIGQVAKEVDVTGPGKEAIGGARNANDGDGVEARNRRLEEHKSKGRDNKVPKMMTSPSRRQEPPPGQKDEPTTPRAAMVTSIEPTPAALPLVDIRTVDTADNTAKAARPSPHEKDCISATGTMLPPPRPAMPAPGLVGPQARPPTLRPVCSYRSGILSSPSRNLTLPSRGPPSKYSLAPPPSHSIKAAKPSRKVVLNPGHSPLDWARLSGHPSADLRGLGSNTPYLRVKPSMLQQQTGRRGKDAWMALSGRVYNVAPYAEFHPGGVLELLRGAARDATKMFGEVHPWVNYESMLAACLVGILVSEEEDQTKDHLGESADDGGNMEEID